LIVAQRSLRSVFDLFCVITTVRFSASPDSNRQPNNQMSGVFCQYSTGAKQLMGLVVILAIFRRGKGMAGAPLQ
jgi:hypothetical protein